MKPGSDSRKERGDKYSGEEKRDNPGYLSDKAPKHAGQYIQHKNDTYDRHDDRYRCQF